jgi:hypothetical protein
MQNSEDAALLMATEEYQEKVTTSPFLYLTLDLPSTPLFQVSVALWFQFCVTLTSNKNKVDDGLVSYHRVSRLYK